MTKNPDFLSFSHGFRQKPKKRPHGLVLTGLLVRNIQEMFRNAVVIDDVNGIDNTLITLFKERIESNGLTVDDLNMQNIDGYIHLYDSLKLYSLAARASLNETGNPNATMDGRFVWNNMRRLQFSGLVSAEGVFQTMVMDDMAERAAVYVAFWVAPKRDEVVKFVEMTPYAAPNCDAMTNKTGCYEMKLNYLMTGFAGRTYAG